MAQGLHRSFGICLGASTISIVELERKPGADGSADIRVVNVEQRQHDGDPKGVLTECLDRRDFSNACLGATGRKFRRMLTIPTITEPEATEYAYAFTNPNGEPYDAIVTAGAETFVVYQVDAKNRVSRISSGNKCASGTGEFFLQQIRRMDISVDEAIKLSRGSEHPHALSGRCSVFCKSDCTHALNKGIPIGDVAAGLAHMIAKKIEELLVKVSARRVLLVGGTTKNDVVVGFLRESFDQVTVPPEAPYFEALGAALWALSTQQKISAPGQYYKTLASSFNFLKPIADYRRLVDFKQMPFEAPRDGDECIIGLDVGSTTTKAVLFRTADEKILKAIYLRTNGNPIKASRECYQSLHEQLAGARVRVTGLGVTGSGRYISGLHAETRGIINEIIAHARAAAHFDPSVDTIYEIGGQDAKYTYLTNSVASDYAMNEACSAGTGSFLEESAAETLGVRMEDIAEIAMRAKNPPDFSDQCAAFISSDINTAFQEGIGKEDIIAGLVYSICVNYVTRVRGSRQTGDTVFMQGGVCYNTAVPIAMAGIIGKRIVVPPHPGLMGAYGVALEVKNMVGLGLLEPQAFDLAELAAREVEYGRSFICHGKPENCDRKCEIAMIHVGGKKFPFGGACNKYYNKINNVHYEVAAFNHVETRGEMLFGRLAQQAPAAPPAAAGSGNGNGNGSGHAPAAQTLTGPVIGINRSFHAHTLLPLYHAFFTSLGCRIVMPTTVRQTGIDKGMTSFCLPGQIALGMFEDLLDLKPDYIFMPQIKEMHVSEQEEYRIEYQTTCMFVQGEPWFQKATFLRDRPDAPAFIAPVFNFMTGFGAEEEQFIQIAVNLGRSREEGVRAHAAGLAAQEEFFRAQKAEGRRILAELESHPDEIAVVLFGRPYNAFADEANKGVPFKFASRGVRIIPFDFLEYEQEENFRDTYWEMGQKIIKAARIVKRHPQLYACYLTNFLCALDSLMVPHLRDLMGTKPSLTIEVDSHTADAGVNTRIEAFLDVVRNYIKIRGRIPAPPPPFAKAAIEVSQTGKVTFTDSAGARIDVHDRRVKTVVPSMGNLFAESAAAVLRGLGWRAEALPVCDGEALELGRSVTTSKECLPLINIIGEILRYAKHRTDPEEKTVVAMVGAAGNCRVGQYATLINVVIDKLKIRDIALLVLKNDDGFAGLGIPFRLRMAKAVYLSDVLDDARSAIRALAVDPGTGMQVFKREADRLIGTLDGSNRRGTYRQLRSSVKELARIRLRVPISQAKYVGIIGEIFVRRDHFSLMGIPEKLAEQNFVMLSAPVTEVLRYTDFLLEIGSFTNTSGLLGRVEQFISTFVQDHHERKAKRLMVRSGLYEYDLINIKRYIAHSTHFIPQKFTGEPGLASGSALAQILDKFCGVINVGPFGCMNSRMTESILVPEMTVEGKERATVNAGVKTDISDIKGTTDALPFLSLELDGNPFSQIEEARIETFLLQANRLHEQMLARKNGGARHAREMAGVR
jgi:predicted CoA-substrate-specific enzyme activase